MRGENLVRIGQRLPELEGQIKLLFSVLAPGGEFSTQNAEDKQAVHASSFSTACESRNSMNFYTLYLQQLSFEMTPLRKLTPYFSGAYPEGEWGTTFSCPPLTSRSA